MFQYINDFSMRLAASMNRLPATLKSVKEHAGTITDQIRQVIDESDFIIGCKEFGGLGVKKTIDITNFENALLEPGNKYELIFEGDAKTTNYIIPNGGLIPIEKTGHHMRVYAANSSMKDGKSFVHVFVDIIKPKTAEDFDQALVIPVSFILAAIVVSVAGYFTFKALVEIRKIVVSPTVVIGAIVTAIILLMGLKNK